MSHTRCNYCGQVVQFIDIRGNNTCPICRQSSTSCCEGGSCNIVTPTKTTVYDQPSFNTDKASSTSTNLVLQNISANGA